MWGRGSLQQSARESTWKPFPAHARSAQRRFAGIYIVTTNTASTGLLISKVSCPRLLPAPFNDSYSYLSGGLCRLDNPDDGASSQCAAVTAVEEEMPVREAVCTITTPSHKSVWPVSKATAGVPIDADRTVRTSSRSICPRNRGADPITWR